MEAPKTAKKVATEEQVMEKMAATGIKTEAENVEAIAEAEAKEVKDDVFKVPSLFINPEKRIRINLEILFDPTTAKVLMIAAVPEGRKTTNLRYLRRAVEWMDFSHPKYDDMVNYRESAMSYDKATQQFLTDPVKLRLCFIRYHLLDWSLKDDNGEKIDVMRIDNSLTSETMNKVGAILPALLDVALTEFEKETLLGV